MRDEASIPDGEHEGRDPILYSREQAAHRRSIADPQVPDAVLVDVVARPEQIDGATEIDHELDLVGAVALGERGQLAAACPRGIDRYDDGSESRQVRRVLQHAEPVTRQAVLHD